MNAVLRAITKLPEIRERSVVRSSVIESAKYSLSGSFDRFVNGRTTIDKRGAGGLATVGGVFGLAAAGVWTATVAEFPLGHAHQPAIAMPITAATPAAMAVRCRRMWRRARPGSAATAASVVDATAVALIAEARTGRAMFLTLCSPISSSG